MINTFEQLDFVEYVLENTSDHDIYLLASKHKKELLKQINIFEQQLNQMGHNENS